MLDELLLIGGVGAAVLLLSKGGTVSATVAATAPPLNTTALPSPISISGGALLPGGYLTSGPGTGGLTGATATGLPTYVAPPPAPTPPPALVGGTGGNAGTGGKPLGAYRLGLGPILPTSVPNLGGWVVNHRLPTTTRRFAKVPGLSRVPVKFA